MTDSQEQLLTAEMLRDFLELLKTRTDLDRHPLSILLVPVLEAGTEGEQGGAGQRVAHGLRALWRRQFRPPALNAELQVRWNAFLILEVMYFYPYAKRLRFPKTLKETALLLCDPEHLALIVADGDRKLATRLIQERPAFWARLIPASMTPAEQTLHSRRDASLRKLARELNWLLPVGMPVVQEQADECAGRTEQAQIERLTIAEGQSQTFTQTAPEIAPLAAPEAMTAATASPTNEPLVGLDGEPLGPNGRRLYEAYGGFMPISPARKQEYHALGHQTYPRELLQRLGELGAMVTPAHLDELALALWPLGFPQSFGVRRAVIDGVWWWDEEYYQRQLIEMFIRTPEDQLLLQCASALRQSSLAVTIKDDAGLWPFGGSRWVPTLEKVAQVAIGYEGGTGRHAVAVAVLARSDHLMQLQGLGGDFEMLTLEITTMLLSGPMEGRELRQARPDSQAGSDDGGLPLP
jgi:hypothetical protein